eukprot:4572904-Pyramimonas_sp.AAC.1
MPGSGTEDAPRAFPLKLRTTTRAIGLTPTSYDPEFELSQDLLTAKHVDDINMTGPQKNVDDLSLIHISEPVSYTHLRAHETGAYL